MRKELPCGIPFYYKKVADGFQFQIAGEKAGWSLACIGTVLLFIIFLFFYIMYIRFYTG